MKDPQVIRTFPDGRRLLDFDPPDSYHDSENVGTGYHVTQRKKGLNIEAAEVKSERRVESMLKRVGYQTFIPCCVCNGCVIIRATEHGELKNTYYACQKMKAQVSRYGTCLQATEGVGPLVIEKDLTMEEIAARKNELVN